MSKHIEVGNACVTCGFIWPCDASVFEARATALEEAVEALRWSSHDGGCFDPAAKVAREWFKWEPCLPGEHNEKCATLRALLSQEPA